MSSRHRGFVQKRTTCLFVVFTLLYLAVAARLAYVQVVDKHHYVKWATEIRARERSIPAARGCIYDRNGRLLAVNVETASVFANLKYVRDPSKTAVQVASLMGEDARTIEEKLNGGRSFVWLGRQVDPDIGEAIWTRRSELRGVGMQRDTKRVYPAGALAAQILGFTSIDNHGVEGLEHVQDKLLRGVDGMYRAEIDGDGRVIPETRNDIQEPENGKDVYLTIDTTIQHITEQALGAMAQKYKPQGACAVVLDPRTGEILALANYPFYDANKARNTKSTLWRNRAVADLYEPGSTLKVVTIAAGLNEGISPNRIVANCTGLDKIPGGRVKCSLHHPYENGHGAVDMGMIIRQSCNIGAAHVAFDIGGDKLYSYLKGFGLLDKTDAGFGCEAVSIIAPPDRWRTIRLANIGFGQGINVTPLQMAGVYATVANGGEYVKPHIIREVRNSDGSVYKSFSRKPIRRVISEDTAAELAKMLMSCVDDGTGKTAQIDGRTVGGKTGSAQVAKANGKGYDPGVFVASFMGFAPAKAPRLVIAIVVNRPQGSHWGSSVAAPVFHEIGEKALWYLRVPADAPSKKDKEKQKKQDGDQKRLV